MKKLLQQALDALEIVQPESKPVGEVLPKWEGGYQVRLLGPVRVGDKLYKESNREAELAARVVRLEAELAVLNQQEPVAAVYTQFRNITDDQLNRLADMCTPNTETGALNYKMFARALEREIRGEK